jgi:hypothetical protein
LSLYETGAFAELGSAKISAANKLNIAENSSTGELGLPEHSAIAEFGTAECCVTIEYGTAEYGFIAELSATEACACIEYSTGKHGASLECNIVKRGVSHKPDMTKVCVFRKGCLREGDYPKLRRRAFTLYCAKDLG